MALLCLAGLVVGWNSLKNKKSPAELLMGIFMCAHSFSLQLSTPYLSAG